MRFCSWQTWEFRTFAGCYKGEDIEPVGGVLNMYICVQPVLNSVSGTQTMVDTQTVVVAWGLTLEVNGREGGGRHRVSLRDVYFFSSMLREFPTFSDAALVYLDAHCCTASFFTTPARCCGLRSAPEIATAVPGGERARRASVCGGSGSVLRRPVSRLHSQVRFLPACVCFLFFVAPDHDLRLTNESTYRGLGKAKRFLVCFVDL